MAVLKGIGVAVVVNGQDLPEFEDREATDDRDPDSITRYIQVTTGLNFGIRITGPIPPPYGSQGVSFTIYVDGTKVQTVNHLRSKSYVLEGSLRPENGKWTMQKFKFADILFTDAPRVADLHHKVGQPTELGSITVKIRRCRQPKIALRSARLSASSGGDLDPQSAVPEKMLKGQAVSHRTSLDQPEPILTPMLGSSEYLDFLDRPYASFNFKYRSRKALQAELIIPRSPSPTPLEERPEETLTREELLELLARMRRSVPTQCETSVKPEVKEEPGLRTSVKRKHDPEVDEIVSSAHVRKVPRTQQGIEVVDLLDG